MSVRNLPTLLCILTILFPGLAWGQHIRGKVVDALDGAPLAGVLVRLEGLDTRSLSDSHGEYLLPAPPGSWKLFLQKDGFADLELALQKPDERPGLATMFPLRVPHDFRPGPDSNLGMHGTGIGPKAWESADLALLATRAAVPDELPSTIRVARYFSSSCSGDIQRIDTIDFEDYVRGVVNAEVGVFQGVAGGPEAAADCWKAFAIAARSYALHFILTQPYSNYDINDTACNQVYSDARNQYVSAAVDATRGQILVKASDPNVIDRYFYAASCAEHGTEPAYATGTILPDPTPVRACVGTWCGHDNCAGHADNPQVAGSDRCLVWGTCQWGSVERSMNGDSYQQILAHYQPNCVIRDMSGPALGSIKGVVYRNPDLNDRISPATVSVEGGPSQIYDGSAAWSFDLEPGTYIIRAEAEGFSPGWVERSVGPLETVWGSIGLDPLPDQDAGTDAGEDGNAGVDAGTDAGMDAGTDASVDAESDAGSDGAAPSDLDEEEDAGQAGDEDPLLPEAGGCSCGAQIPDHGSLSLLAAGLLSLTMTRRVRTRTKRRN